MKKILYAFICALLIGGPAQAQTILNNTTLASAQTSTSITVILTTATFTTPALAVGHWVVVPGIPPEVEVVTAINGTSLTVQRGGGGTRATAHASSTTVFVGPANRFKVAPPPDPAATCVRAQIDFLPWVDITSGIVWTCGTLSSSASNIWRGALLPTVTYASTFMPVAEMKRQPDSLLARLSWAW